MRGWLKVKFNIDIPDGAKLLIRTLQNNGHSSYVVGGCVRDSILRRPIHDWDICTSATPEQMLEVFKDRRVIETGLQHGTITVVVDKIPYEITTYRIDGDYSDNRRPDSVTFTDNLIEDLKRRDFTINAMAYNDEQGLIDPFGGFQDIQDKVIRCVGSAKERFGEDALRILRAIRFASQLQFKIEAKTSSEIINQYKSLKNISIERINSEFCKIAMSNSFYFNLVSFHVVFSLFIPELNNLIGFDQNNPYHSYDVFMHTVNALSTCDRYDLTTVLATFFHDFGKPHCYQDGEDGIRHFKGHGKVSAEITDSIMRRLKFDNDTRNNVVELVYYHDATFEVGKKYVKRWLNKIGEEQFRRLLKIRRADIKGQKIFYDKNRVKKVDNIEEILNEILNEQECFCLKDLAVNGKDLIEIGYKPGRTLGNALKNLLEAVIAEKVENNKIELIKLANKLLKERNFDEENINCN